MGKFRRHAKMVMTRAPLRVSFAGGGTDIQDYYERDYGAVFSATINKYVYVTVKQHGDIFRENYRLNYAETEIVSSLSEIENDIIRESLKLIDVEPPLYISTIADVPSSTGLGSSSTFCVALLNALHAMRGERVSNSQLAEEACHIEIEMIKNPIGKQDQVAAAFGGLNHITFQKEGAFHIEAFSPFNSEIDSLFSSLQLYWTGITRQSKDVLSDQKKNINPKRTYLDEMRKQAERLKNVMKGNGDIHDFGKIMHDAWMHKRQLSTKISSNDIDTWYEKAMQAGAIGGKLCGAGGGGFLLFVVDQSKQAAVEAALAGLKKLDIHYEPSGVEILVCNS